jgi:outer membrane protein assembly factor BamB
MRLHRILRVVACAIVLALTSAAVGDNWPRFRGTDGTGTPPDKDIPIQWTKDDGSIYWKTPIPGVGHSSPVVWGDRIFLQSSEKSGEKRYLLCLDAGSGKVQWQKSIAGKKAHINQRNSLASSTPAVDGERVYTVFWDGEKIGMYAYDFSGKLLWQRDLGGFESQHGPGGSPIVYDGKVIYANDQDPSARLIALDVKTGQVAWQQPRKHFRACYSTPFVLKRDGRAPELIVGSTDSITAYNPRDGAVIWYYTRSFDGMPLRTVGSPIAANGMLFAPSGDGSGARHMIGIKMGDKGDVTQSALAWEDKVPKGLFPYVPCMLALGDHLYAVNDLGFASCHEAATGKQVWSKRLGSPFTASPLLVDGKVYAVGEDGEVYVFKATTNFELIGRSSLGESVTASPAVANGRLYVRTWDNLYCIGKPK